MFTLLPGAVQCMSSLRHSRDWLTVVVLRLECADVVQCHCGKDDSAGAVVEWQTSSLPARLLTLSTAHEAQPDSSVPALVAQPPSSCPIHV